jgi:chromosome segregation ATPase
MSFFGAPSMADVIQKEVEKYEKEISSQEIKAVKLQAKNNACETKERELRTNMKNAETDIRNWIAAHGGMSARPAYDATAKKIVKNIEKTRTDIMKINGECGIVKRDLMMANSIQDGMQDALDDFKQRHGL